MERQKERSAPAGTGTPQNKISAGASLTPSAANVNDCLRLGEIHRASGVHAKELTPHIRERFPKFTRQILCQCEAWEKYGCMVRTLDGVARAVLSARYRRIDNYEVASAVLPVIGEMDSAMVASCELTDTRMYIKVVTPKIEAEIKKGDVVQAGVLISNSEVGLGSINVSPFILRLVCTNGMVAQDNSRIRKRHIGRINEFEEDFTVYRPETVEADDKAFLMKLTDSVKAAVDEARFARIVGQLQEATTATMEAKAVPKVVELAAKEYGLTKPESEGVLGHLIAGGDLSRYGLANAVTRLAQDATSYDRSTELEATGYEIITMAPSLWQRLTVQ